MFFHEEKKKKEKVRENKARRKHEKKRVRQSCFFGSANIRSGKAAKRPPLTWTNFRWCHAHRTTCWAQNGPSPCHDKQVVGEKRKGKLINAATHASFLFQVNNTIIVQQGLWHGFLGGGWLFCKINNLENRFLRFLAPFSNVGWLHTSFKNNVTSQRKLKRGEQK